MCDLYDNKIDIGSACLSYESCFGPALSLWATHTHTPLGVLLYSVEYCNDSTLIWASIVSMHKAVSFFCRGDIKSGDVTYLSTDSQEHWRNTLFWIVLEKAVFNSLFRSIVYTKSRAREGSLNCAHTLAGCPQEPEFGMIKHHKRHRLSCVNFFHVEKQMQMWMEYKARCRLKGMPEPGESFAEICV